MNFGEAIKAQRKKLGITQEDLSRLAEISVFKITQLEKHDASITLEELARVGKAVFLNTTNALKGASDV